MAQPATGGDRSGPSRSAPKGTPAEPPEEAADAVTGLDMVLVDAARGPLRRMVPPVGTAVRFGSALARQPGPVARRHGLGTGEARVRHVGVDQGRSGPGRDGN